MPGRVPLPTLLSQALVAFTIEFDNEFEHRATHWTTVGGGPPAGSAEGTWLTSMAMWLNRMLHVTGEWMPAGALTAELSLPALLARLLVGFAIEFETEFEPRASLAISADVLRVLDERPIRLQDVPRISGVSREAITIALGVLEKRRLTATEPDPAASRGKVVRLTSAGLKARNALHDRAGLLETRWVERFGEARIGGVRTVLEPLVGDPDGAPSPLFAGLEPYPDGWRASVRRPDTLPHFPMVLHRGAYPDGS